MSGEFSAAEKQRKRHRDAPQAGKRHPPVKNKHQDDHGNCHGGASDNVRQIVGKQRLRLRSRPVKTIADQAGSIGIKETERGLHQMRHALLTDIGSRTERSQMCAHQRREIDRDPGHGKTESHPSVAGDAGGFRPVRRHIQCHHQAEADGEENDADIGMFPGRHFRNQFLHDHVQHGPGCEGQKIWHCRNHQTGDQNGNSAEDRFHRTGQDTQPERHRLAFSFRKERHGNDRAFRKVLDRDSQCQSQRPSRRDIG